MQYTDVHIRALDDGAQLRPDWVGSLLFPGPRRCEADVAPTIEALFAKCVAQDRLDFTIQHDGRQYRGRRDDRAVDGVWFRLRCLPDVAPDLASLPSPLPPAIKDLLVSECLLSGGLVYVTGRPGNGKTTTASGIVVSRLRAFGGVAYTVEDPPEMPLNGWHGSGYCTQTSVCRSSARDSNDWVESMRGVLRSQPVGTPLMMYVGEVRDAETARAMVLAASNGFLVVSTGFAANIMGGIDALLQMCGRDYLSSLAATIRVVLHQQLTVDAPGVRKLAIDCLESPSDTTSVAAVIRNGRIEQLHDEIEVQRRRLRLASGGIRERFGSVAAGTTKSWLS